MKIKKGTYTALVTPFLEPEGEIDFESLERLIDIQIYTNNGLVVLGTTAETPTLSDREKEQIIRLSVKKAKNKVPIIAGTGTNSTKDTIIETKRAEELGVDGALIVTPYYNRPTDEGIFRHFLSISKTTTLPIIVYNIQSRTGKNISPPLLKRISQLEGIIGVKEASGDINQMMDIRKNLREDFLIFSGDDSLTLPMLSLGADGVISVISNIYPGEINEMVNNFFKKNYDSARDIHYRLLPFTRAIFKETNPIGIKYAMSLKNLIKEAYRLPLCEMNEENKKVIREIMKNG
ncbi:MAG: 4-hydroxy-tetrahydrodipicolinate synthase [Planctomycetota bacterium]